MKVDVVLMELALCAKLNIHGLIRRQANRSQEDSGGSKAARLTEM